MPWGAGRTSFIGTFKPYREWHDDDDNTEHYEFHFRNGYGASVIRGPHSYGGPEGFFELAVLKRNRRYPRYWDIDFKNTLTDDVIGWLNAEEVTKLLEEISRIGTKHGKDKLLHTSYVDRDGNVVFVD